MSKATDQLNAEFSGARIRIDAPVEDAWLEILTPDAVRFVASLQREFGDRRKELLARREVRQQALAAGNYPDFAEETRVIRDDDWRVADIPADLTDRRVEITGPVDRKMIINALNSGASVFMADFEDANSPTWSNCVRGQINLRDAVNRTISFTSPEGKKYALNDTPATLVVRPRGWHLDEKHMIVDGEPMSASLFDFGLYLFHNTKSLLDRGSGPYFYLPKLEHHLEARLWNDVFTMAQLTLGVPYGTIRATVLIETILAAFEMDEILYELREHSSGLNCGRWDYIFSFIKCFRHNPDFVLPDRGQVTMERHFLNSYVQLLIETCHRRGAHAMGGMAAQIPIKNDPKASEAALDKVRQDKLREVRAGHDGTWVAHPGLIAIAKDIFDEHMPTPNQIGVPRENVSIAAADLLSVPTGTITEAGLRQNINVGILYLESWLRGNGCVPIYNLMEDAATAEISRSQVWQWLKHGVTLEKGPALDDELIRRTIREELEKIRELVGPDRYQAGRFELASEIFENMMLSPEFPEFMTLVAYDHLD